MKGINSEIVINDYFRMMDDPLKNLENEWPSFELNNAKFVSYIVSSMERIKQYQSANLELNIEIAERLKGTKDIEDILDKENIIMHNQIHERIKESVALI